MAESGEVQEKFDHLVGTIATTLTLDVCSIYLQLADDELELYATHGLNPDSVHHTRLKLGEGLVGHIAQTAQSLAVEQVKQFKGFAERPETGEQKYKAMAGVPILHSGRVIGVLAVQTIDPRPFHDSEIDGLATIAMVVAEIIMHHRLLNPKTIPKLKAQARQAPENHINIRLEGQRFGSGLAMGRAVLHQHDLGHDLELGKAAISEDPAIEYDRLHNALDQMRKGLDRLIRDQDPAGDTVTDILRIYRVLADDKGWIKRIEAEIDLGLAAETAILKIRNDVALRARKLSDPMMRERLEDLTHVANRLLRYFVENQTPSIIAEDLPDDAILVARTLDAAELLEYDRDKLQAVILEEGSPNSHLSIVARAMGLPMIGRVKFALRHILPDDKVAVDAANGQCFINPDDEICQTLLQALSMQRTLQQDYRKERDLPVVTKDGESMRLMINASMLMDIPHLYDTGAAGIGLFRTELSLMLQQELPTLEQLITFYKKIYDQADGKPVVFRLLDLGGDKRLPYYPHPKEDNPVLGWRAVRLLLDRPELMALQCKALILAANGRPLQLMIPMVSTLSEFNEVKARLTEIQAECAPSTSCDLKLGIMLEVPALIWQIPDLANRVDFISIGSNDLMQFFFAADRTNPRLGGHYDALNTGWLRFLSSLIQQCNQANIPLSLCGEMAAEPAYALALIALGLKQFSVRPSAIGGLRRLIRTTPYHPLKQAMMEWLDAPNESVREALLAFMVDHGIEMELQSLSLFPLSQK